MTRKRIYIHMKYPDGAHVVECPGCRDERDDLTARALAAEMTVERVREFVDGFAERGDGHLTAGDELWIMSIRRELDGSGSPAAPHG